MPNFNLLREWKDGKYFEENNKETTKMVREVRE